MTKREKELLEEIAHLKVKLIHAENWMTRQVEESYRLKRGFFDRFHKQKSIWNMIVSALEKIRHFHIFKRHYSLLEIWEKRIEAFFVWAAIILFWRGIWNLADHYLFPGDENKMISAFASLLIGMMILILTRSFVNQFLDEAVEEAD